MPPDRTWFGSISEFAEEPGRIQIVLARFVDHAYEIVGRGIRVAQYRVQLSLLE